MWKLSFYFAMRVVCHTYALETLIDTSSPKNSGFKFKETHSTKRFFLFFPLVSFRTSTSTVSPTPCRAWRRTRNTVSAWWPTTSTVQASPRRTWSSAPCLTVSRSMRTKNRMMPPFHRQQQGFCSGSCTELFFNLVAITNNLPKSLKSLFTRLARFSIENKLQYCAGLKGVGWICVSCCGGDIATSFRDCT